MLFFGLFLKLDALTVSNDEVEYSGNNKHY